MNMHDELEKVDVVILYGGLGERLRPVAKGAAEGTGKHRGEDFWIS